MYLVSRTAALLFFTLVSVAAAKPQAEEGAVSPAQKARSEMEKGDPLLGSGIAEALMFGGRLWLRGNGALVTLDPETGERDVAFPGGVRDLAEISGELWVLRRDREKESRFLLSILDGDNFAAVATLETAEDDEPFVILDAHGEPGLLSDRTARFFRRSAASWRRVKLQAELPLGMQISVASPLESPDVYVGFNAGEFGGGLRKLNTQTGAFITIQRDDGKTDDWNGPPLSERDQITGLQPDPDHPQCVYASIGLFHLFLSRGRIVRVCGEDVTVFFEKRYKEDPFGQGRGIEQTDAIYSLAVSSHGVWAVSKRALYFLKDGQVSKEYALSGVQFENVAGTYMNRKIPGVIVIATDVNWAVSTSGYTPLVVPLP